MTKISEAVESCPKNRSTDSQTGKSKAVRQKTTPQKPGESKDNNAKKQEGIFVALSDIVQDDDTFRCRVQNDKERIEKLADVFTKYLEAEDRGEKPEYPFDPVWVRKDGDKYVLVAGYHRYGAGLKSGADKILVSVFEGTKKEAIWFAMQDNSKHGSRLGNGDLKLCLAKALKLFPKKNPAMIAEDLGCSHSYAYRIASEFSTSRELKTEEKRVGRDGKMYSTQRKTTKQQKENISEEVQKQEPPKIVPPKVTAEKERGELEAVSPATPEIFQEPPTVSPSALPTPSETVASDELVVMKVGRQVKLKSRVKEVFEYMIDNRNLTFSDLCACLIFHARGLMTSKEMNLHFEKLEALIDEIPEPSAVE